MRSHIRLQSLAGVTAVALATSLLAACASPQQPYGQTGQAYPAGAAAPMTLEYGRVTGIEYLPVAAQSGSRPPNVVGAVVGGLAGAALGNQVGSGSGRAAATVLGGVGGAAVGSQYGGGASAPQAAGATYRITVQTDQGVVRTYEVSQPGDLRVGDRVRVENNVIYRS